MVFAQQKKSPCDYSASMSEQFPKRDRLESMWTTRQPDYIVFPVQSEVTLTHFNLQYFLQHRLT